MMKIGLAKIRRRAGLSQRELAENVGCHIQSVVRIENGRSPGSEMFWRLVAYELGLSVKQLERARQPEKG